MRVTAGARIMIRASVRKMTTRELALGVNLTIAQEAAGKPIDPVRAILVDAMRGELTRRNAAAEHGPTAAFLPVVVAWAAAHPDATPRDIERFAFTQNMEG